MEDLEELFPDEGEDLAQEQGANRTFIILVAALGGVLVIGICAFIAWAVVIAPRMTAGIEAENHTIRATNTAVAIAAAATETAGAEPTATHTPPPTEAPTSIPTRTPTRVRPTATPPSPTGAPTATPWPTATPTSISGGVPSTGIGALKAAALAMGLTFLLVLVRRLRRTA